MNQMFIKDVGASSVGNSSVLWCSEEQLEAHSRRRVTAASFQEEEQDGLNRLEGDHFPLKTFVL